MGSSMKIKQWMFLALLVSGPTAADWTLDPAASYLGFGSVKNDLIAENHSFGTLTGAVTSQGNAVVTIDLTSVETNIPIRNERIMQMLFHTDKFPLATVATSLNPQQFVALAVGGHVFQDLDVTINLHGNTLEKTIPVKVVRSGEGSYDVSSTGPIFIHASQFALSDGVEALRKIAGLVSIDLMVPVTVDLRFNSIPSS